MGSMNPIAAPALIDLGNCPDLFCSGIAKIDRLPGGCLRFVHYVEQTGSNGQIERIVVAKTVWPLSALPNAMRQTAQAMTEGRALLVEDDAAVLLH